MSDYFSLLGLPARPGLDDTLLKERYFDLASRWHPDSPEGDTEKFSELQEALKTLRDPAARLRYLVDLQFPDADYVPAQFGNPSLFMTVGSALQKGKTAFDKRAQAKSNLARAVLASEVVEALKAMSAARDTVDASRQGLLENLAELDASWPDVSAPALAALAGQFTYLARWREELAEWEFKLAQD